MFDIDNKINLEIKGHVHKEIIQRFFYKDENRTSQNIEFIFNGYSLYQKNYEVLMNKGIIFENFFKNKNSLKEYEEFNDTVYKTLIQNKANQIVNRCFSTKHRIMLDDLDVKVIEELVMLGFDVKLFKNNFSKKISLIKNEEELKSSLLKILNNTVIWNNKFIHEKITKNNLKEGFDYVILFNESNKIALKILTFKASFVLGSSMWCITRNNKMFEYYRESIHGFQSYVFEFNFNKKYIENDSILAYLYDLNNNIESVFFKNDDEVYDLGDVDIVDVDNALKKEGNSLIKFMKRLKSIDPNLFNDTFNFNDKKLINLLVNKYENPFELINESDFSDILKNTSERVNYTLLNFNEIHEDNFSFINKYLSSKYRTTEGIIEYLNKGVYFENEDYILDLLDKVVLNSFNISVFDQLKILDLSFNQISIIEKKHNINIVFKIIQFLYDNKDCDDDEFNAKILNIFKKTNKEALFNLFKIESIKLLNNEYNSFFIESFLSLFENDLKKESFSDFVFFNVKNNEASNIDVNLCNNKNLFLFEQIFEIKSEVDLEILNYMIFKTVQKTDYMIKKSIKKHSKYKSSEPFFLSNHNFFSLEKGDYTMLGFSGVGKSYFFEYLTSKNSLIENLNYLDVNYKNINNKSNIQEYFNDYDVINNLMTVYERYNSFNSIMKKDDFTIFSVLFDIFDKYNVDFNKLNNKLDIISKIEKENKKESNSNKDLNKLLKYIRGNQNESLLYNEQ